MLETAQHQADLAIKHKVITVADLMACEYVANWLIDDLIEQSDLGLILAQVMAVKVSW